MKEISTESAYKLQSDDDTPSDAAFLERGYLRHPDGSITLPVNLNAQITQWLDQHDLDASALINGMVQGLYAGSDNADKHV